MNSKIIVTGGAGFIGAHVSRRLVNAGYEIVIIDNFDDFYDRRIKEDGISDLLEHPSVRVLEQDVRECESIVAVLSGSTYGAVVHLAAKAGVRPSIEDPMGYQSVNVIGTQSMLEVARRLEISSFVFASSSSVYGNNNTVPFHEEQFVGTPISPYAASKRTGELLCHVQHHLFGLSVHCLRFFTVYGPRQRPDLAIHKFANHLRKRWTIPMYGDGTTSRDYTYIDDIATGVLGSVERLLGSGVPEYEILNLGGSQTTKLVDLISMLGDRLGVEPVIEQMDMQPGDVERTFADLRKSGRLLSYSPETDMEVGLDRFCAWFKLFYGV